ncbi:ABC transporter ATP-binding protein [Lactobacillus sp. UCMA15818]|uniref:metal ABC transporter ATP-binding protein n=1 Tax=Lactobacillaceae TaxID=33958 RepID=UPI0025AF9C13|nr:ABC transporter ATP-binding protein [Lactobacillus sp. UCMA15818]MDN2453974.1 ABC transporter ATP-binding protein [Lactobacillus sp. UCMA15818]
MQFEELEASYGSKKVFSKITGEIVRHNVTTILGPNGSGKTTLMLMLAHLMKPTTGKIKLENDSLFYLPQRSEVYDYMTVKQLLEITHLEKAESDIKQHNQIIAKLGLTKLLNNDINSLSGGQQQRVWLAYAFLQPARILLLDEPLTYLDVKYQQVFYRMLVQEKSRGRTFLISLHDIEFARRCSEYVWFLTPEKLVTGKTDKILILENILHYLEIDSIN